MVWRRRYATRHYVGYVLIADDAVRLAGHEEDTGIYAVLSIPHTAILESRLGRGPGEDVDGERAVVVELPDDDPILVRPATRAAHSLDDLARRLCVTPDRPDSSDSRSLPRLLTSMGAT